VKATLSGTTYTFDNGLVQAKINTSDATMPSFIINGVETMTSGGYFSWGTNVYTAGPFTGTARPPIPARTAARSPRFR
jgi:hypothetical protein